MEQTTSRTIPDWITAGAVATWYHGKPCQLGQRPIAVVVERVLENPGMPNVIVRTLDGRIYATVEMLLTQRS